MSGNSNARARHRRRWRAATAVITALCLPVLGVGAQTPVHLIAPNPVPQGTALPGSAPGAVAPPPAAAAAAVGDLSSVRFVLRQVRITGATAIPHPLLAAQWQSRVGTTVTGAELSAIANVIATLYANAGYALINVQLPAQNFADGVVLVTVQEGYVDQVAIEGNTDGADLDLLKTYAARIIVDRPLRQRTLERYILLMNDIPGLKVGSKFEPIPGHPGAARLALTIMRKRFEAGGTLSTQGNPSLGGTQVMMNVVGNSLLRQGERTQFAFGAPVSFNRYQYYGLSHVEPLGDDGATLTVGAGRLVTHPHANSNVASGTADTLTVRLSYPMIRGVHETLVVNADLSLLNSNAAFLGQAISDERTRSIRVGALYGREDPWNGTTIVSATFSQGLDVLGARRGSIAFGGPEYSKVTALLAREQALPLDLVLRLKLAGQFAFGHLPSTEQFLFGGPDIGKAFDYAFMVGDRGIGAYAELAHAWPGAVTPDFLAGSELFGYIDWGQISNIDTIYQLRYAHAASAGGGMRVKLLRSLSVEAGLGWSLNQTSALPKARGPRFIFGVSGHF